MRHVLIRAWLAFTAAGLVAGALPAQQTGTEPTGPALANSPDALIERGLQLRRAQRDSEALELFERAYATAGHPRALAQVALAKQALGRLVEAERDLARALQARNDGWIAPRIAILMGALESIRGKLGYLIVQTNAPNARLRVDGVEVPLPSLVPLRLAAGAHDLELVTERYGMLSRKAVVPPRAMLVERVEIVQTPNAAQGSLRLGLPHAPPKSERPQRASLQRTLGWGFLGASGASLITAVVAHVVQARSAQRYNDEQRCLRERVWRDQQCGADRGAAEAAGVIAKLGYVAAVSLGTGASVLLLTPEFSDQGHGETATRQVAPNGVLFGWSGKL